MMRMGQELYVIPGAFGGLCMADLVPGAGEDDMDRVISMYGQVTNWAY